MQCSDPYIGSSSSSISTTTTTTTQDHLIAVVVVLTTAEEEALRRGKGEEVVIRRGMEEKEAIRGGEGEEEAIRGGKGEEEAVRQGTGETEVRKRRSDGARGGRGITSKNTTQKQYGPQARALNRMRSVEMKMRTLALKLVSLKSISSGGTPYYIIYEQARFKE
jgi:hypothetical protein